MKLKLKIGKSKKQPSIFQLIDKKGEEILKSRTRENIAIAKRCEKIITAIFNT